MRNVVGGLGRYVLLNIRDSVLAFLTVKAVASLVTLRPVTWILNPRMAEPPIYPLLPLAIASAIRLVRCQATSTSVKG